MISAGTRVFLCTEPQDMRRGFVPSWPKSRVLELAPAYWKQTLEQEQTRRSTLDGYAVGTWAAGRRRTSPIADGATSRLSPGLDSEEPAPIVSPCALLIARSPRLSPTDGLQGGRRGHQTSQTRLLFLGSRSCSWGLSRDPKDEEM